MKDVLPTVELSTAFIETYRCVKTKNLVKQNQLLLFLMRHCISLSAVRYIVRFILCGNGRDRTGRVDQAMAGCCSDELNAHRSAMMACYSVSHDEVDL